MPWPYVSKCCLRLHCYSDIQRMSKIIFGGLWAGKNSVLVGKDTSSMGKRFLTFQRKVLLSSSGVYGVLSQKNGIPSSTSNQTSKPASTSIDLHNFEFGLSQLHYFKLCYKLLKGQAWSTVRDRDLRLRKELKNKIFLLIHVVRATSNTKSVYSPVGNTVRTLSSATSILHRQPVLHHVHSSLQ